MYGLNLSFSTATANTSMIGPEIISISAPFFMIIVFWIKH